MGHPTVTYQGYRAMAVLRTIDTSIAFFRVAMQAVTNRV